MVLDDIKRLTPHRHSHSSYLTIHPLPLSRSFTPEHSTVSTSPPTLYRIIPLWSPDSPDRVQELVKVSVQLLSAYAATIREKSRRYKRWVFPPMYMYVHAVTTVALCYVDSYLTGNHQALLFTERWFVRIVLSNTTLCIFMHSEPVPCYSYHNFKLYFYHLMLWLSYEFQLLCSTVLAHACSRGFVSFAIFFLLCLLHNNRRMRI